MSDQTQGSDGAETFWTRVRTAVVGLRTERQRVPAYGQSAIARSIGLKPRLGSRIEEELANGWLIAAARKVSLSLIVIEIDRVAEYYNAYGRVALDDSVAQMTQAVSGVLPRADDSCLRLGRASLVIVLPDMPVLMARATAAKIDKAVRGLNLAHKESHAGTVTVSAGIAICNPQGSFDRHFFEAASEALKKAQRKGIARLEAVDLRGKPDRRKAA